MANNDKQAFVEVTFQFPREYAVTRGNGHCMVEVDKLSPHMHVLQNLFSEGLKTKIGDSAAGSREAAGLPKDGTLTDAQKKEQGAKSSEMMAATRDTIYEGVWKQRREGESVDPLVNAVRWVIREIYFAHPAYAEDGKRYKDETKGQSTADKGDWLDAYFDGLDDRTKDRTVEVAKQRLADLAEQERVKAELVSAVPVPQGKVKKAS